MDQPVTLKPALLPDLGLFVDGDLLGCQALGLAVQADMRVTAAYDAAYFDKCAGYEGSAIAAAINAGRVDLVHRHYGGGPLLDIGVGSGEFIRKRGNAFGYDVNPVAERRLKTAGLWCDPEAFRHFAAFSFWDVIEHLPDPEVYFRHIGSGALVFASLPIFADLGDIRGSKHYRPGEHLWYFTEAGFVRWMGRRGFRHVATSRHEMEAGREAIGAFVFVRVA